MINPMLDARYVQLWDREPERLPASVRALVESLIAERNVCPDARVDEIDRELVALLRPFVDVEGKEEEEEDQDDEDGDDEDEDDQDEHDVQDDKDQLDQVEGDEAQRFACQVLEDTEAIDSALARLQKIASEPASPGRLLLLIEVEGDAAGLSGPGPLLEGEPDPGPQDPVQALVDLAHDFEAEARGIEGVDAVRWRVARVLAREKQGDGGPE